MPALDLARGLSLLRTERTPTNLMFMRCGIIRRLSLSALLCRTSFSIDSEIFLGAPNFLRRARARAIQVRVRSCQFAKFRTHVFAK